MILSSDSVLDLIARDLSKLRTSRWKRLSVQNVTLKFVSNAEKNFTELHLVSHIQLEINYSKNWLNKTSPSLNVQNVKLWLRKMKVAIIWRVVSANMSGAGFVTNPMTEIILTLVIQTTVEASYFNRRLYGLKSN